jgi:hypothetical protein
MFKKNFSKQKLPKPEHPPGSLLFFHATGRWAKKIRGRLDYFGRGSYEEAFTKYKAKRMICILAAFRAVPPVFQRLSLSRICPDYSRLSE